MKRLVSLSICLLLTACGDEPEVVTPTVAPKKKVVEAAPISASVQVDYNYNALNKRDPFRSVIEKAPGPNGNNPDPIAEGCKEPLCLLDLDEMTVVAVVSGDANPLAMVEDRSGIGHIVRRNTRIGKEGGKVIQILRDCIVVLSFVSGGTDNKPQPFKQNLCVQTESQQGPALDLLRNKEFVP